MKAHLMAFGCDACLSVVNGYTPPNKVNTFTQKEAKKNNSMEMEVILDGLSNSIKGEVEQCKSTKKLWKKLVIYSHMKR